MSRSRDNSSCDRTANHITADMIAEGAVVADVGINVLEDGTLCGDVDYENVREKVSHITPVPGGVGNVTTSVLRLSRAAPHV